MATPCAGFRRGSTACRPCSIARSSHRFARLEPGAWFWRRWIAVALTAETTTKYNANYQPHEVTVEPVGGTTRLWSERPTRPSSNNPVRCAAPSATTSTATQTDLRRWAGRAAVVHQNTSAASAIRRSLVRPKRSTPGTSTAGCLDAGPDEPHDHGGVVVQRKRTGML